MTVFRLEPPPKRRMQVVYDKDRNFRPISRFISEMIQDMAIVTMERQQELVCDLSDCAISNNLE